MKDIRSEVYNALAEVVMNTNANKNDMTKAIEWFQIHFWNEQEYIPENIDEHGWEYK